MSSVLDVPALWGLGGAFIYAGPRFSACYFEARRSDGQWSRCAIDGVIALLIGLIAAGALGVWAQQFFAREGSHELRALSTVIGLLANPCAPGVVGIGQRIVDAVGNVVTNKIKGSGS